MKTVADQIIKNGKVTDSGRAALNITGRTVVDDDYRPAGVALVSVERGGPRRTRAAAGDTITKVGSTRSPPSPRSRGPGERQAGRKVTVTYTRDGDSRTAEVTLGEI